MATVVLSPAGAAKHGIPANLDVQDVPNDEGMLYTPISYKDRYIKVDATNGNIYIFEPGDILRVEP